MRLRFLILAYLCFVDESRIVFYGFSIGYLVGPGTLSTSQIVEVVSSLPDGIKYAGKAILAAPFAFHSLNGLRHLSWDLLKCTSASLQFFYFLD